MAEALDIIQDVMPKISRQQVYNTFNQTLIPSNKGILKTKPVVAQITKTKQSDIAVKQNFCWLKCYNGALDQLIHFNTGLFNNTGNIFGSLIHHFVYGGDEKCFQSRGNGKSKVIGSQERKKHEKKYRNSRVSIMMYCTGSISGVTGPTVLHLKGKTRQKQYTYKWLMNNGAAIVSNIIMTPT